MLRLEVSADKQELVVYQQQTIIKRYAISTAKNGLGEKRNSGMTPRGLHVIRAKIGANSPINSIFVGRRATGEVYSPALRQLHPERDWILTRILWLSGLELHKNRLGQVDSMRRYIYIHGTSDENALGTPASHGCIRMSNKDVMELFDLVPVGTEVMIK